jgi:hypothetical protein
LNIVGCEVVSNLPRYSRGLDKEIDIIIGDDNVREENRVGGNVAAAEIKEPLKNNF